MPQRVIEAIKRLTIVFQEIPETQLSVAQASRLAGVDPSLCEPVISALEDAHVLKRTHDGRYLYRPADASRA
ncbi:MAG TPA: hypothetical protein VH583_25325 [Vicinamibacterales bacterium]|jgi:predicted transcriptional regulator of viral defense system